jgi:hypothetical protein
LLTRSGDTLQTCIEEEEECIVIISHLRGLMVRAIDCVLKFTALIRFSANIFRVGLIQEELIEMKKVHPYESRCNAFIPTPFVFKTNMDIDFLDYCITKSLKFIKLVRKFLSNVNIFVHVFATAKICGESLL